MIRKKCKQIITCTVKEPWVAYLWIFFDSKFSKCLPAKDYFQRLISRNRERLSREGIKNRT